MEREPRFEQEKRFYTIMKSLGIRIYYESHSFIWHDSRRHRYTPDFMVRPPKLYIELSATRQAYSQSKPQIKKTIEVYGKMISLWIVKWNGNIEKFGCPYSNSKIENAINKTLLCMWG